MCRGGYARERAHAALRALLPAPRSPPPLMRRTGRTVPVRSRPAVAHDGRYGAASLRHASPVDARRGRGGSMVKRALIIGLLMLSGGCATSAPDRKSTRLNSSHV